MVDFHINHMRDFIGKKLADLDGFEELLVVAISRDGRVIIPYGGTTLEEGDVIYVIGESSNINNLAARFKLKMDTKNIKKVMILGGGKISYYLAKRLIQAHIRVTV